MNTYLSMIVLSGIYHSCGKGAVYYFVSLINSRVYFKINLMSLTYQAHTK